MQLRECSAQVWIASKQAVAGSNPVSRSNRTIQARSVCESTGQP